MFDKIIAGKEIMDIGIAGFPLHWKIWVNALVIINLLAIFFIKKREAQYALAVMLFNMVIMTTMAATFGFTKILGAGHILWVFLLIYLYRRYKKISVKTLYGKWIRLFMIVVSISLVIDIIDVIKYFVS